MQVHLFGGCTCICSVKSQSIYSKKEKYSRGLFVEWWLRWCVWCCFIIEQPGEQEGSSTGPNAELGAYVDDDDNEQGSDSELLFRCRICCKGFKHPISLTLHKDLHTGQTRCPICQRIFSRSYDMRVHLFRIHKRTLLNVDAKIGAQTTAKKKWAWKQANLNILSLSLYLSCMFAVLLSRNFVL